MKGLQFDVERRADGLRIYARLEHEIVGAIDVENCDACAADDQTDTVIIFVAPRWRGNGIAGALRKYLALYAADASCIRSPFTRV